MTHKTSSTQPDAAVLARAIVQPYLEKQFGESNFVSIDTLRKAFLSSGHTLPEFTTGLKYLLDNKLIKRVNDHELTRPGAGEVFLAG